MASAPGTEEHGRRPPPERAVADGVARSARPTARLPHVPALDGLRGVAVAGVLAFHGGYLDGGWLGVDLFLVLSGYLITSLLLFEHHRAGTVDLARFWGRRARRLLPALLALLVAVAAVARWEQGPVAQATTRSDGLATLGFVANWHDIVSGTSYWERGLAPSLLAHTWSLAVEEQVYLVWPVVLGLLLTRRRRPGPTVALRLGSVVAVASAAAALGLYALGASTTRVYEGTDTRVVAVALGAAVAGWRRRPGRTDPLVARAVERAAIVAAGVLAVAWWGLDGSSPWTYRGGLLLASLLGAVVVAGAADPRSRRLAALLSLAPLVGLGRISYGLYLWHWPTFQLLDTDRTGMDGPALFVVRVVASLGLALASWFLLERPVRSERPSAWWTGRRGAFTAVAAIAVVAGLLVLGTPLAEVGDRDALASGVRRAETVVPGAPTVLVVGDSVGATLAQWPLQDPAGFGVNVVRNTGLGCRVIADGTHRIRDEQGEVGVAAPCTDGIGELAEAEQPALSLVLFGGWVNAEIELDGAFRSACDPEYRTWYQRRVTAVIEDLARGGGPVVLVTAARAATPFQPEDTPVRMACVNDALRDLGERWTGAAALAVVDYDAWLCPVGSCRERLDGQIVRTDGLHLDGPGAAVVARWLLGEAAVRAGVSLTTD